MNNWQNQKIKCRTGTTGRFVVNWVAKCIQIYLKTAMNLIIFHENVISIQEMREVIYMLICTEDSQIFFSKLSLKQNKTK